MLLRTAVVYLSLIAVGCQVASPSHCLRKVLAHVAEKRHYLIENLQESLEEAFRGLSLIRGDRVLSAPLSEAPQIYWIALQSPESLEATLAAIVGSPLYRLAMFVVVTDETTVQNSSQVLWKFRLPDSIIVSLHGVYTLELINCGASARARRVCTCDCYKALQDFDFKTAFTGCPLKVLWVRYPPYMYEPNQTWGWKGIFVDFLDAVSHASQRPIQIAEDDAAYVDEVYQGYSYDSVLRDLQDADIFIGAADTRLAELFHISSIIEGDYMMLVAPKALVDYWNHLQRALSNGLLGMFGLTFIAMATVLFYLARFSSASDRGRRMGDIMMLLYGTCMGIGGHARLPKHSSLRLFLGLFLLVFVVLSIYLQGTLISVLSGATYEPPISNVEELIGSELPLKLTELFKLVFELGTGSYQKADMMQLAKRLEVLDEPLLINVLDALIREKNFATLMINAFMFMRPNLDETFGFFPVGSINVCFVMGKNSFSSPQLDAWISRALESGFFEKYKRLHHFELALKWHVETDEKKFVVALGQLGPALEILKYGYVCGLFALLIEVLYSKFSGHTNPEQYRYFNR